MFQQIKATGIEYTTVCLREVFKKIKEKLPKRKIVLYHDNVPALTGITTDPSLESLGKTTISHRPKTVTWHLLISSCSLKLRTKRASEHFILFEYWLSWILQIFSFTTLRRRPIIFKYYEKNLRRFRYFNIDFSNFASNKPVMVRTVM